MRLISHRGNINGKNPSMENKPDYVKIALNSGFEVEVDVWYKDGKFYLGHDEPQTKIMVSWLKNPKVWVHCKNLEAFFQLHSIDSIHSFWHQNDDVALTTEGYFWTYPGIQLTENSICVLPETCKQQNVQNCVGICSDFINNWTYLNK